MADYATRSKVRGWPGHNAPLSPRRRPIAYQWEQFHLSTTPHAVRPTSSVGAGHCCCNDVIKAAVDDSRSDRTVQQLATGLFKQHHQEFDIKPDDTVQLDNSTRSPRKPIRSLFTLGRRGRGTADLLYPRAVAIDAENGDIYVADTGNKRIQRYTNAGIHLGAVLAPSNGDSDNYFREPTGVAVPAFGLTVVVADRSLSRILIFTKGATAVDHQLMTSFATKAQPYCVMCDSNNHIILSTTSGTVEVYDASDVNMAVAKRADGTQLDDELQAECHVVSIFTVRNNTRQPSALYVATSTSRPDSITISDPVTSSITWYTYDGKPMFEFKPSYSITSLADNADYSRAFVPSGINIDAAGQLYVVDGLNGAVCVFDEEGRMTRQLIKPSTVGSIQAVAIGPEGHFVCAEYETGSAGGSHCVRVYSYRDCSCHSQR